MKKKIHPLRWILLAAGIIAVVGLTGMNVYSLYTLRSSSIESESQSKKIQIAEFADRIRHRFFEPFIGLGSNNMETLEQTFLETGQFPEKTMRLIYQASKDSIFQNIYYIPANSDACGDLSELLMYNATDKKFKPTTNYSTIVCDGMGIARTRMKALIEDYQYNNKVLFDTHRSMVIALVNQNGQSIIGYLTMPINRPFMVDEYLQPALTETFGAESNSALNVWLRNWTNSEIIASSNPAVSYTPDNIQIEQQFPDFFDDWRLYASINEKSVIASSRPSLLSNLIVLGAAFIFLIGQ